MSETTHSYGAGKSARRQRAEFFQGLAIKVGFVALLAFLGKAPLLLAMSNWFFTYAFVSIGFAFFFRQLPGGRLLNYWDESAIFFLFTFLARFANSLVPGTEHALPG